MVPIYTHLAHQYPQQETTQSMDIRGGAAKFSPRANHTRLGSRKILQPLCEQRADVRGGIYREVH